MDKIDAFVAATERLVEATKANTIELHSIKNVLESQRDKLEKIEHHFTNGFKSSILSKIAETEKGISEKMSTVTTGIKVQWAIITIGLVPVLYYFVHQAF